MANAAAIHILVKTEKQAFELKDFFDQLNTIDSIPISLSRWEMTGLDDEIRRLTAPDSLKNPVGPND